MHGPVSVLVEFLSDVGTELERGMRKPVRSLFYKTVIFCTGKDHPMHV